MLASEAAVAEADAAAAEIDRGLASLQGAPVHKGSAADESARHVPSAAVAEKPLPGTGASAAGLGGCCGAGERAGCLLTFPLLPAACWL